MVAQHIVHRLPAKPVLPQDELPARLSLPSIFLGNSMPRGPSGRGRRLADLTPFERRGGKLLLLHGTADSTIPTRASVFHYQRIAQAMGQPRTDSFVRLYLIPGYGPWPRPLQRGIQYRRRPRSLG